MSRQKPPFILAAAIGCIFFLLLFHSDQQVFGEYERRPFPPIFDGNDGIAQPHLILSMCEARDIVYTSNEAPVETSFLKSRKVVFVEESWLPADKKAPKNPPPSYISRALVIKRWYFENSEDPANYPNVVPAFWGSGPGPKWDAPPPPGWGPMPKFGDRTAWFGPRIVAFTKGRVLVHIYARSGLSSKEYTAKIAKIVEGKLQ